MSIFLLNSQSIISRQRSHQSLLLVEDDGGGARWLSSRRLAQPALQRGNHELHVLLVGPSLELGELLLGHALEIQEYGLVFLVDREVVGQQRVEAEVLVGGQEVGEEGVDVCGWGEPL